MTSRHRGTAHLAIGHGAAVGAGAVALAEHGGCPERVGGRCGYRRDDSPPQVHHQQQSGEGSAQAVALHT